MITHHKKALAAATVIILTAAAFSSAPAQPGSRVQSAGSMRIDEKGTPAPCSISLSQHHSIRPNPQPARSWLPKSNYSISLPFKPTSSQMTS